MEQFGGAGGEAVVFGEERRGGVMPSFGLEDSDDARARAVESDAAAVELWDRLLVDGLRVTPLGGSDAHVPEGIGCCWTALPGVATTAEAVIEGLNAGCCLASEAPLLAIHLDGQPMGAIVQPARRQRGMTLKYRVADAAGLQCVRIIADGRIRQTLYPRDTTCIEGEWPCPSSVKRYVRFEARAADNRRAFSAPIYLDQ